MTSIFSSLMDSITTESFAWWFSRATLVAAIACGFLALSRRARPATRHAVAIGSLVAMVLLPAASAILPTLSFPVLPASPPPVVQTPPVVREVPFAIDTPAAVLTPAPVARPAVGAAPIESKPRKSVASIGRVLISSVRDGVASLDRGLLAVLTWLTVTSCLLLWTAMGAVGARRLSRGAWPVNGDAARVECERVRRMLGIGRTVDVGVSRDVAIPMVVGALRPRVVIPASAAAWSSDRLRAVLLHEFAHVSRRDGFWMLVARTVTSLLWFHPLVWVLAKQARRDAERACDEIVLASGVRGSDYAEHLVAIARGAARRDPLAGLALAFATRSTLEGRVVAILSARVPRTTVSRRAVALATGAALALFVTIAAARPTTAESARGSRTESYAGIESRAVSFDVVAPLVVEPSYSFDLAAADISDDHGAKGGEPMVYLADNDEKGRSGHDWYSRATDLYHGRRYQRAGEAYENAARLGYRRDTALYNAGCSYALADQKGRALDVLREAFDEGFDRPDLFAEDSDLNSLRGDPRFQDLLNDVMSSGSAESARRAAKRDYDRLAKQKDIEEGDWNSVGIDLLRSGDYEGAADAFGREFEVSKDEDALYNKACARSLAGKKDEAMKLLEQSITTGSIGADHMQDDPDLVALHDDARFDQMVSLAQDLELHNGSWWNSNGKFSWKGNDEKRWRRAIPHFEEMTRKHPQVGRAWFNLGYAQLEGEEAKTSASSFKKALDLGYRPATTMYNLACSSAQSGDIEDALAWLEKAEGAGMRIWNYARWDDDLDPLRSNARFKEMAKRWRAAEKEKHAHDEDWEWDDEGDNDKDS